MGRTRGRRRGKRKARRRLRMGGTGAEVTGEEKEKGQGAGRQTGQLHPPGRPFIHSFAFWDLESLKSKRNRRVSLSIS